MKARIGIAACLMIAGLCLSPLPAYADCVNPIGTMGQIIYNGDTNAPQYCDGDDWRVMIGYVDSCEEEEGGSYASCTLDGVTVPHGESETFYSAEEHANCANISQVRNCDDGELDGSVSYEYANCGLPGCPNVGDQCDDDSYYIGENGSEKIYATTATYQVSRTWNNGSSNWTVTGVTSTTDGAGNTGEQVNLSDAGAPYEAADSCDGLTAHGHSDWYLPAKDELDLFWNEGSPVAGVNTSGSYYWSSTELTNDGAWVQRFSDGSQENYTKGVNLLVRCVRSAADRRSLRALAWPSFVDCAGGGGVGVPTGCPNVGDQCDDDSYYIGENGTKKIYATTSTYQVSRKWANGYSTTGVTSMTDGAGNTDDLVNLSDAGAPYEAADYCEGLSAHGHSDWYLPAKDELDLFWNEGSPVAGVVTGSTNWYWSSTEYYLYAAWMQRFSDGFQGYDDTNYTLLVRCVRSAGYPSASTRR